MSTNDIIGFGTVPAFTTTMASDAYNYLVEHGATLEVTRREFSAILEEVIDIIDGEAVTIGDITSLLEESLPATEPELLERIAIELLRD